MKRIEHPRVSAPPFKPLLVWDGECHFCRRWIERWREMTAGKVEYVTYQEATNRFPEIPIEQFKRAIALIEPDGKTFFAAEAVYRSLRGRSFWRWLSWSYDRVPGFAAVSELAYKLVARNRGITSAVTRLLWGNDVRPPTYSWARRWFLRALGVIYLIAFSSLWVQVDGLIGSNGISPIDQFLPVAREQLGARAYSLFPTLCWFNSSNAFLHFLCAGGVVASLLLIIGFIPVVSLVALFAFYLSLTIAGQTFLSFQWDILLLETGFLAIFLAPWQIWPRRISVAVAVSAAGERGLAGGTPATTPRYEEPPVSRAALFLLKLLLFKLMVMSGVVKLTSGDISWWNLTALDYHYWSQPLPTIFAWWADKSPEWFKHFSVAFCLVVEIIVPFFIWAPRRLRLMAAGLMILLQIAIAITGNYCFFNLLTVVLCLLLIDDATVGSAHCGDPRKHPGQRGVPARRLSMYAAAAAILVTLPINGWLILTAFKPDVRWPRLLTFVYRPLEPFRIVNGYGLFRVMTKDRGEIIIEGSADGIDWLPYEFKWKPGNVMRAPGWCAPHQPRLDWQMWFAALGSARQNPWFGGLIVRLLQGSADVSRLLAHNPFADQPPRYIRASFYRYRFTTVEEHRQSGAWWKRQELGGYLPTVSLDQVR